MAWSRIAGTSKAGNATAAVTTNAINPTGANLIVVGIAEYGDSAANYGSLTDTSSNSWGSKDTSINFTSLQSAIWHLYNPTVTSSYQVTYTPNAANGYCVVCVEAWSGATSSPLDQTATSGVQNASPLTCGSVTPGVNNELIFAIMSFNNSLTSPSVNDGTITANVGYTSSVNEGAVFVYYNQATAAAVNITLTYSGGAGGVGTVASFKPGAATAASGGGGALLLLGNMIGWTPSLSGLLLPAGLAVGRKASELIRSGTKISRRKVLLGHNGGPPLND